MEHILQADSTPQVLEIDTEIEDSDGDIVEVVTAVFARQDQEGFTEVVRMQSNAEPPFTLILIDGEGCVSTVVRSNTIDNCRELLAHQKLIEAV